ncbi:MAG: hypothetical protein ACF8XB_18110, partial [Planctomycetota bacterium JB042]
AAPALTVEEYFTAARKIGGLPLHLVRSSEGRDHFFFDDETRNAFLDGEKARLERDLVLTVEGERRAGSDFSLYEFRARSQLERALEGLRPHEFGMEDIVGGPGGGVRFVVLQGERQLPIGGLLNLLEHMREAGRDKVEIQRYKGLGEMNPEQLWESTMDPETRTLYQVRLGDDVQADDLFTVLMGESVEPRRDYIERHALEVRNLDV